MADLQFIVDEHTVTTATDLPLAGEHWFKSKQMKSNEWRQMLKNPCQEVSFRAGVSRKDFKREWRPVLEIIHRYVTYDGHLSSTYVHHLRLMTVFLGWPINIPHYLVQSMTKMSSAIKKGPKNIG